MKKRDFMRELKAAAEAYNDGPLSIEFAEWLWTQHVLLERHTRLAYENGNHVVRS